MVVRDRLADQRLDDLAGPRSPLGAHPQAEPEGAVLGVDRGVDDPRLGVVLADLGRRRRPTSPAHAVLLPLLLPLHPLEEERRGGHLLRQILPQRGELGLIERDRVVGRGDQLAEPTLVGRGHPHVDDPEPRRGDLDEAALDPGCDRGPPLVAPIAGHVVGGVLEDQIDVDHLLAGGAAERQRRAEAHPRDRAKAAAKGELKAGATEHPRDHPQEVEVAHVAHRPRLGEVDPDAGEGGLGRLLEGRVVVEAAEAGDALELAGEPRRRDHLRGRGRGDLVVGDPNITGVAELDQRGYPLGLHLRHVAGDPAVVADEPARLRLRLSDLRVVDLRPSRLAAGGRDPPAQRLSVLPLEEALVQAHVQVVPGQAGPDRDRPGVASGLDPRLGERREPAIKGEELLPAVEAGAAAVRVLQRVAHPPIPAGEETLEPALAGVVGLERDLVATGEPLEQIDLAVVVLDRVHRRPLEGRVRLGHVLRDRAGHGRHPRETELLGDVPDPLAGLGDADHVLLGLAGQTHDEVHLHPVVAALEDPLGRGQDVLVADVLVDDVAHPLGAGLGGEGQPRDADALDPIEQLLAEAVGPQRSDPELDLAALKLRDQLLDQGIDAGHVGGAQRGQAGLAKAPLVDAVEHRLDHLLGIPLADRAVDHPRLAKATALGAAAGDLDGGPVEDRFGVGDRELGRKGVLVEVADPHPLDPLGRTGGLSSRAQAGDAEELRARILGDLVVLRDVDPGELDRRGEHLSAARPGPTKATDRPQQRRQDLLRLTDEEDVDEGGERRGMGRGRPPGEDDRILVAALRGPQRHAAELEVEQHVAVAQLVLEADADDVELGEPALTLEADERQPGAAKLRLEVLPRAESPLADEIVSLVDQVVEDPGAEVAHPDLVEIGEGEDEATEDRLVPGLADLLLLTADVAARLGDPGEQPCVGVFA